MSTSRVDVCELHSYCNELRRQEKFSDVIIKVENRTFPCHRIILASAVEYFRSMFSGSYNEATQKEVELKGVEADDFELLLTHIYGGSVDLQDDNVFRLLRISNYVGLDSLSDFCEEYIIKNKQTIPLGTVLDIFLLVSQLERIGLVDELAKHLAQYFLEISKEDKLFLISRTEVEKILSHLDMVANRVAILDFVVQWTKRHPAEVGVLDNVLTQLEVPLDLWKWFTEKLKENAKPFNKEDECVAEDILREEGGIFYNSSLHGDETSAIQSGSIQSPMIMLYCGDQTGGFSYISSVSQYKYNPISNCLQTRREILQIANMIDPCTRYVKFSKSVFIDGIQLIFFVFYYTDARYNICNMIYPLIYSASMEKTIGQNIASCNMSGMHAPSDMKLASYASNNYNILSSPNICVCTTNVYFYNAGEFLKFNGHINRWTNLEAHKPPLWVKETNSVSYQNNLYILGGESCLQNVESGNGKIFQRYDPREGTWSQLPHMIHSRVGLSSCVHKDQLYAVGGKYLTRYQQMIECYDFKVCKWRVLETKMPTPKKNPIVIGDNDQLYFIGGDDDFTGYSYNLKEGTWSNVSSIPRKRGSVLISKIFDAEVKI